MVCLVLHVHPILEHRDDKMLTKLIAPDIVEVEGLRDPTIVEDAISRLVMDEGNKGVIKAIARTYTESRSTSRFNADFIHGKGEGQILLLHGPPGTGKTLTAGPFPHLQPPPPPTF